LREGLDARDWTWDWFTGEKALGMDPREFIPVNSSMMPAFMHEKIAEDEQTETFRDSTGRVRTALKAGAARGMRSWDNFRYYMEQKPKLLAGKL